MIVGDLVTCRGIYLGLIVESSYEDDTHWVKIFWGNTADARFTWEEVEPSFVPGIIEVISENR